MVASSLYLWTLTEVSDFIFRSEECVVKTFKLGKSSEIANDATMARLSAFVEASPR